MPMDACLLLLGCPWEFDSDALHHGRTNTYTLLHKGKKITLVPMTPTEIVKYEQDKAKQKGVVSSGKQQPIKLKQPSFLATKMDLAEIVNVPEACYAFVCKRALFSLDDASVVLPPCKCAMLFLGLSSFILLILYNFSRSLSPCSAIANLLLEYMDVSPSELPPGIPSLREGLSTRSTWCREKACQTMPLIGPTQRRLRRFSDKSKNFWYVGTFMRALVPVLFLFYWFLRKMAGACV
jgi:hypothetical protein